MRLLLALLVFLAAATGAAWAVFSAVGGSWGSERRDPKVSLDAWAALTPQIERLRAEPPSAHDLRIAFLGDSTTVAYPGPLSIPSRLQHLLNGRAGPRANVRVSPIAFSGMNPFDYYFLADPVQSTQPDRIVMNFNMGIFSDEARAYFSRPELAGWIRPHRWLEAAALPLHWQGLTFDQLIFRSGLVQLGAADLWRETTRQAARLNRTWLTLSRRAQGRRYSFWGAYSPRDRWLSDENARIERLSEAQIRDRYALPLQGVPADHPVFRVLTAAIAEYTRAQIWVTVYLSPVDVEYFDRVGVREREGFDKTIRNLRAAVESPGGHFIDLHRLLPHKAFRDAAGHLAYEGGLRGTNIVAIELARSIAAEGDWWKSVRRSARAAE